MPIACALPGLHIEVGRIAHAFDAACHIKGPILGFKRIRGKHHGLQAAAARLINRQPADAIRESRAEPNLTRHRLSRSGGHHLPHNHFIDQRRINPAALNSGLHSEAAKLNGG